MTEKEKVDMMVNKIILRSYDFISEHKVRKTKYIDGGKIKMEFETPNFTVGRTLIANVKREVEERPHMN